MRLIDADKLIEVLRKNSIFRTVTNAEDKSVIKIIEEQPIAYDLDKVVEQLEELKDKALKRREELIELNSYNNIILKNIEYERGREYAFDDAIDIVKDGEKCKTNMCIDCSMATYSQGRPYCEKEERHLDSFSYKPDWCSLKAGGIDEKN